jgi:two-component system OmpR family response regulator
VEECDDGALNSNSPNSCRTNCVLPKCGDNIIDNGQTYGEECDDGNNNSGDGCDSACLVEDGYQCSGEPSVCEEIATPVCGDGIVQTGEACDDGNSDSNDGCNEDCEMEQGYECQTPGQACNPICGDGIVIFPQEDDAEFASLLTNYLARYNLKVTNYEEPYLGLSSGVEKYDLLILDLTLPNMDGLEVCKEVVAKYDIPIIISSARSDLSDKVTGLQIGADDYLPKPYDPQEMYARIISLLRRYKKINSTKEETHILTLNEKKEQILLRDKELDLTPAEFVVLQQLIKNRGSTVSKEQILYSSDVFQYGSDGSLSVIMNRLRKKVGSEVMIKTIRGVGYRLVS